MLGVVSAYITRAAEHVDMHGSSIVIFISPRKITRRDDISPIIFDDVFYQNAHAYPAGPLRYRVEPLRASHYRIVSIASAAPKSNTIAATTALGSVVMAGVTVAPLRSALR